VKESAIENNNVSWALKTWGDAMKLPNGKLLVRKMNGMGARSWPDRLFVGPSRAWFIEYKKPGQDLSELQTLMVAALRRLGWAVFVVDNAEEGRRIITACINGALLHGYHRDGSPA
jgi:hypothetical protein